MVQTYAKAYTEVLEILSHFSEAEYSKIPKEKINFYKENMDKDYIYIIDPKIDLSKQYISKEANAILISLFRDYFATEKQKTVLENLLNQNQVKLEKEKREKYNPDNIFKKDKEEAKNVVINEMSPAEYKESIIKRIMTKILKFFHFK